MRKNVVDMTQTATFCRLIIMVIETSRDYTINENQLTVMCTTRGED